MEVKEIYEKKIWEDFLLQCKEKTFLQSWSWGQFHISMGNKIWRFGIYEQEELRAVTLVVKIKSRRASFLLVPHGPIVNSKFKNQNAKLLSILLEKLKELAKQEKVDFIRISPILIRSEENDSLFKSFGFKTAPLHYHPESSWKLNIEPKEQELFDKMRKTTKYLIKKAQNNKEIEIFQSKDINDIEIFNKIHLEVVKKQKFVPFSLDYFKKEFLAFLPDNNIAIFFAKYQGKIIAASYGIFWSHMSFYHHAALLPEYRKIPVSYLLQWEAIKEEKNRGCYIYDFWGYSDPVKSPKHPYSGPTLFKMGFGGYKEEYVKTQDFIITKKYWLNFIIEKIRKIKRGL